MIRAFVFDLFGTLIDTASKTNTFSELNKKIGNNNNNIKSFIEVWNSKQLQYAWLNTLLNQYEPFSELSKRALKSTARIYNIHLSNEEITKLNEAKLYLEPFPDSKIGLEELKNKIITKEKEIMLVVLSNGERDKTEKILLNNSMKQYFDHIFSVEEVKKYKPSPEPYIMTSNKLNMQISELSMVSSNLWDIAGAQSAGIQTCCWINRREKQAKNTKEELDDDNNNISIKPNYTYTSIKELKELI